MDALIQPINNTFIYKPVCKWMRSFDKFELSNKSKILTIYDIDDLKSFAKSYSIKFDAEIFIHWKKVMDIYDGFLIIDINSIKKSIYREKNIKLVRCMAWILDYLESGSYIFNSKIDSNISNED